MKSPAAVRQFFKTVLQQVCHFEVDVIAGDANAAAYKYYKSQEVNTGHPFESKLHYSTKNHPPQLHAANDLDFCFMAILPW